MKVQLLEEKEHHDHGKYSVMDISQINAFFLQHSGRT